MAAAAGGGFAPLAVASLDVAAPEETPSSDHVALHMYTYITLLLLISSLLRGRGLWSRRSCSLWWRSSILRRWSCPLRRRGCTLWREHSRPHHVGRWKPYHIRRLQYISMNLPKTACGTWRWEWRSVCYSLIVGSSRLSSSSGCWCSPSQYTLPTSRTCLLSLKP